VCRSLLSVCRVSCVCSFVFAEILSLWCVCVCACVCARLSGFRVKPGQRLL